MVDFMYQLRISLEPLQLSCAETARVVPKAGEGEDDLLDPEHPPPGRALGEDTTQHRAQNTCNGNGRPHKARHQRPRLRRAELKRNDHGQHVQPRAADALERPKGDQLFERLREAAAQRESEKHGEGREHSGFPPCEVAELCENDGKAWRSGLVQREYH